MKSSGSEATLAELAEGNRPPGSLLIMAIYYFTISIIFGGLSVLCVWFIARNEGHLAELKSTFMKDSITKDTTQDPSNADVNNTSVFLNIPAIVSIVGTFMIIIILSF